MCLSSLGILTCALLASLSLNAQQTSTAISKDPQAVAALQHSVAAMGGTAPMDSTAMGTVAITAGSRTENGTLTLLTRGVNQTSEKIAAQYTNQTVVFSNNRGARTNGSNIQTLSIEGSLSAQSPIFPLPFLINALNDQTLNCRSLGIETGESGSLLHVQFWRTLGVDPRLQALGSFTLVDVWLDPISNLPVHISYGRRDAGGSSPATGVDVFFSGYGNFGGILYPMTVQESLNGTPWAVIAFESVAFNGGLNDLNFPVQ